MKFIKLFLPVLLFLASNAVGQVWHLKRSIQWLNTPFPVNGSISDFVSFRGASYMSNTSVFPDHYEVVQWTAGEGGFSSEITMADYEEFPGELTSEQRNELLQKVILTTGFSRASLKSYLQITVSPFRINPENGKLQRLTDFIIKIESAQGAGPVGAGSLSRKSIDINETPLSGGQWFRIRVPSSGMYKLTWSQLVAMGVENPSNARIFGCGGKMLPEDYRLGNKDQLKPVQLHFVKGADNIFNAGDYLLFYGQGPEEWKYSINWDMLIRQENYYTDHGYYFVTSGSGGPDLPAPGDPTGTPSYYTSKYDSYASHETVSRSFKDNVSGMRTGKEWFGEDFTYLTEQTFNFTLPGLITAEPVKILTQVLARSKNISSFYLSSGNAAIDTLDIRETDVGNYTATAAYLQSGKNMHQMSSNTFPLRLKFVKREGNAMGWLDHITVNGRSELKLNSDVLLFRDKKSVNAGQVSSFEISMADSRVRVWDVSNPNNILSFSTIMNGDKLTFTALTDTLREFVAFREDGNIPAPQISGKGIGPVANQDLHGIGYPDMIIVTHADFLPASGRLAEYRRTHDNLDVTVVSTDQVFNEFSSGSPDPTAIRNFMKYLYDKANGDSLRIPRYLLLMGDGSYDNKGIDPSATNYVLTYQSDNSTSPSFSYVSDDYYGLLDPGESMYEGMLDIGVGRLPVKSVEEAEALVSKIISYDGKDRLGDWRNSVSFIADDEDENVHMLQANQLADLVTYYYPDFNVNKIFLDAYRQVSTPTGQKYPDVNTTIREQMEKGMLILNYTGHGGVKGLAHEQIMTLEDIDGWKNSGRLPLFMTATCEFSRFDEHEIVSAGERVLLNFNGGGIALFTTTRLVYSAPNHALNERFYEIVFEKGPDGSHYRLGDIMKFSKNRTGIGFNKRNFSLLGDPSLVLAYPGNNIVTDSINGIQASFAADTIGALQRVSVCGHLEGSNGKLLSSFTGIIYPSVYDKETERTTLGNDGGEKRTFMARDNLLYRGKATVESGKFKFTFIVPKDISYSFGHGKLSYYASDSVRDASGSYQHFVIGGTADQGIPDNTGPHVEVYMNDTLFKSGGITGADPVLYVTMEDVNGINTTGNGIGHEITAYLDGNTQKSEILNEYYEADLDNYRSGTVKYPLFDLREGPHTINVKVWDVYNNSGEGTTEFYVLLKDVMRLNGLLNFPNPFSESTYFVFEHNKSGNELDITIQIFNISGEMIRTIIAKDEGSGYRSHPVYWDGKSEGGADISQGIYFYRVRVTSSDGMAAEKSGKLIIYR